MNAVLIIAAAHALLLAPPPPAGSHCVETQRVWGPFQMVLSCDSYQFVASARDPAHLLAYRSWNQARPLGVMAASLLTLAESKGSPNPSPTVFGYPYGVRHQPGWLPYVLINFIILLVALMLFRQLNAPVKTTGAVAVAVLGTFLIFNDVVKGFFWSAHTQMWNVLMPLISISLSYTFLRRPVKSWLFMTATGLLLGIGFLAYGSLVVCVVAAIVSIALGLWTNRERPSLPELLGKLGLFLLAFAAPVLIWIALVKRVTGAFFSPEAEIYRQFVWIFDSWKAGGIVGLLHQARIFFFDFVVHLANVSWPALLLLAIVLVVRIVSPARLQETIRDRSFTLGAAGITFVICLGFFSLMGFYRNRLEFNVVMPVLVIASILITGVVERLPRSQTILTLTLVIFAAIGFVASALLRITWPY